MKNSQAIQSKNVDWERIWDHGRSLHWTPTLKPIPSHPKNVQNLVLAGVVLYNFLTVADPKYADASYGDR